MSDPIKQAIDQKLYQDGFINIADFMVIALQDTIESYYRQYNPFTNSTDDADHQTGDFITAPEISQIFGELIGLWSACWWLDNGYSKLNIAELGPGRGLLMRDFLRATQNIANFHKNITIDLVDINHKLIAIQQRNLARFPGVTWHKHIYDLPKIPTIFIANEYFDALPIQQYINIADRWYEIVIKRDNANNLYFTKHTISDKTHDELAKRYPSAKQNAIVEISAVSDDHICYIINHLKQYGGAAIIIDYGYDIEPAKRSAEHYGSTLQAIKQHKFSNILENIGKSDISAHVDFNNIKRLATQQQLTTVISSQRQFLLDMGIKSRLKMLQDKVSTEMAAILAKQVARLIDTGSMGTLFNILIIYDK